ncbi:MAG: hypothetical protein ACREU7_04885, partial [Burkholderiales bacterium]
AFATLRREVLCRPRDAGTLRREVVEMRSRMRAHLEVHEEGYWDIKQGEGGLIDIEFICQYLLLREAHAHPEIVHYSDNWRQLEALSAAGRFQAADAGRLLDVYRIYRSWQHAQALRQQATLAASMLFLSERQAVIDLWRRLLDRRSAED